ncbi:DUF1853 family protein [Snodgrassella sp. CFCC 13594]|uniref:DUF1853 family protein n=1 Tax=Snodgrassella sp. CFCC 13594 TaxID=1775559 RepID=UPI0008306E30|nr:DUF1853 family protein [Snodgrassella sp. CFCC 13594]
MNYALDALWWRLKTPMVRDLASLLTAPAPWLSGCELPVSVLLGDGGFRYLLALDDEPSVMHDWLVSKAPFGQRLGLYAESLLAFWFTHAPHSILLAHNLALRTPTQTVGAADFMVRLNGVLYHLELACKYYGGCGRSLGDFVGLNPQDAMENKIEKIQQQLRLSQHPAFQVALMACGIHDEPIHRATVLRGMLFAPALPSIAPINRLAWQGGWGCEWAALATQLPENISSLRFASVPRLAQLSPLRQAAEPLLWDEVEHTISVGMVAVLEQRADEYWHEVMRLMKTEAP